MARPICHIVAGANGAGKTTFALRYLPRMTRCKDFLNVDEIARGISPLDPSAGAIQAGRIFLEMLRGRIAARRDFAFETTLSGRGCLAGIRDWQRDGWQVTLIYLFVPDVGFSLDRVRQRSRQGGHDVPESDVLRRYPRSLRNLFVYSEVCDRTFCFDNSFDMPMSIFERFKGGSLLIRNRLLYERLQETLND